MSCGEGGSVFLLLKSISNFLASARADLGRVGGGGGEVAVEEGMGGEVGPGAEVGGSDERSGGLLRSCHALRAGLLDVPACWGRDEEVGVSLCWVGVMILMSTR